MDFKKKKKRQNIDPTTYTWRRGDQTSLPDLSFKNELKTLIPRPLSLSWIGSNHAIIAGALVSRIPEARTYPTIDWTWWESYAEDPPAYTPSFYNETYQHLLHLYNELLRTKTVGTRSKKWWDAELDD